MKRNYSMFKSGNISNISSDWKVIEADDFSVFIFAGVAELADALDLGSSALGMQVQFLSPAPFKNYKNELLKRA